MEIDEDFQLAATLFSQLGESIPHEKGLEAQASELEGRLSSTEKALQEVIRLCGDPVSPCQYYVCAMAYSLLGKEYCRETIRWAEQYLHSDGWAELSGKVLEENGITVESGNLYLAKLLRAAALAHESLDEPDQAYSLFHRVYALEPYNAMDAIKSADLLAKTRSRKEAYDFLLEQKNSMYYQPVRYLDVFGHPQKNDLFRRLLDAEILKYQFKMRT